MARDEKRSANKDKLMECSRFKQHNERKKDKISDGKQNDQQVHSDNRQKFSSVSASSSDLSRNVITNVDPKQSAAHIKRTGAVFCTKKPSMPPVSLKGANVYHASLHDFKDKTGSTQTFEAGPPPRLNSLHRLNQKVSDIKIQLETADSNSDKEGLKLAEDKLVESPNANNNFRKNVSKKVDISPEEQLYSSLANLSISSTSMESRLDNGPKGFWVERENRKGRDPEPKLEWFHQPYEGAEVLIHPSDDMLQMLMDESYKVERELLISTPSISEYNLYDI